MGKGLVITLLVLVGLGLFVGGSGATYVSTYNELNNSSIAVDKAVVNIDESYRRRADLIPNLVEAIKAEVGAEQDIVVEYARMRANQGGQIKLTPELMKDPQALAAYKSQQGSLGNFLGRLMVVSEKIPDPNFSKSFQDLRTNLEGLNNRIGISIRDYNDMVEQHNQRIGSFWAGIFFGNNPKFKARDMYKAEDEKKANPLIKNMDFNTRMPKGVTP